MPVNYKKLWILLIERGISKVQFREMAKISTATLTKLNKNEYVALEVLTRICNVLNCDIGDIVQVEHDRC
jgi:DNA-binding Xre family transcriptional regulator